MSKRLSKAMESLGSETIKEMEAMSPDALKGAIVQADRAMSEVAAELESNPKFESLKEDLKSLTAGKREVDRRQKSIIQVALFLLNK